MNTKLLKPAGLFAVACFSLLLASCGGNGTFSPTTGGAAPSGPITVTVVPAVGNTTVGGQFQFTAKVTGTSNKNVTWFIAPVNSDQNATASISPTGFVSEFFTDGSFTITAKSVADPTVSGTGTLNATGPDNVKLALSPLTPSLDTQTSLQFTATVTGTTNTEVTWSVYPKYMSYNGTVGTISSTGLLTGTVGEGTVIVTVQSDADYSSVSTEVSVNNSD